MQERNSKKYKYCVVQNCKNNTSEPRSYHFFPKNEKIKKVWLKRLRLKSCGKFDRVCSAHFSKNDFCFGAEFKERKKLKKDSVPQHNLPQTFVSQKKINTKLVEARRHRLEKRNLKKERCVEVNGCEEDYFIQSFNSGPNSKQSDSQQEDLAYLIFQDNNTPQPCNVFECDLFENSLAEANNESMNGSDIGIKMHEDENLDKEKSSEIVIKLSTKVDVGVQTDFSDLSHDLSHDSSNKEEVAVQFDSHESKFLVSKLIKTDEQLNAFTGITSFKLLDSLVKCMQKLKSVQGKVSYSLSHSDRIILTMMRVKLNLSYTCLSVLFSVCPNTCTNTFSETIRDLSIILTPVIRWPPKEEILQNIPKCFEQYKSTVGVLDCTEMKIERVNCLKCRLRTCSYYKGTNTAKVMVCITPSGLISHVSPAYSGHASDKQIFNESEIITTKTIPNRDSLMVDKGFLIDEECSLAGVKLIRPPFLKKKKLSRQESQETASIAAARVHVERAIQRLKQFQLLKNIIPYYLVDSIDYIMTVVCGLVNLSAPILSNDKFL